MADALHRLLKPMSQEHTVMLTYAMIAYAISKQKDFVAGLRLANCHSQDLV